MEDINSQIQEIVHDVNSINTRVQRLQEKSLSNNRSITRIKTSIVKLIEKIRNVKHNIERNKNSSFLQTSNVEDLQLFIASFLNGLDIELTNILQNI